MTGSLLLFGYIRQTYLLIFFLTLLTVVRTADRLCEINREGFGRFERVQLTSHSINVRFTNSFDNLNCPSIRINALITESNTGNLEQTIEDIRADGFQVDRLLSNRNYSIEIRVVDQTILRILPRFIFETLQSSNTNIVTLTNTDLLAIEQIESFLFPQTHLYLVTVPIHLRRATILGNVTLSYDGKKEQYRVVEPLSKNVVSRLYSSKTTKTIAFRLDLPDENHRISTEYSVRLQLFFADDQRQSILDHPVQAQFPPSITVDFLPPLANDDLGRAVRVHVTHLCSSYLEIKGIVLSNTTSNLSQIVVARAQCDITKNDSSRDDIAHGRCSLFFDKLRPEQVYSLSIRATCQFASPTSPYIFYDRAYFFPFQTPSGFPDGPSPPLFFHNNNRTFSWRSNTTTYLGPESHYELFTKSNDNENNWTLIYRGNQTEFELNSNLIEMKNATYRLYIANRHGRQEQNYSQIQIDVPPARTTTTNRAQIVLVSILASLLFLTICGLMVVGCYLRNRNLYGKLKKKYCGSATTMSDKELEHLRSLTYGSSSNLLKDNILYTWNHTPTMADLNRLPTIVRSAIKLERLIGKGAFGEVYAGSLMNEKHRHVAVKTLLSSASASQRLDFVKEAIIMNQFDHKHIVRLIGVCLQNQTDQPQFLVLELMEQGDLQNYLRRARPLSSLNKNNGECQLTYEDCLDIARQIADGACYLEQHSYVHRDLAARNCLVSSSGGKVTVKIGDFGLARLLSQQDYYRKTGEALLPVRWMAPESLLDALFTSQSDIWSFGIVLWEIVTLGQVPYSTLNNQQVISLVTTARGTLEKPLYCTQILYELMLSCWHYIPENRIDFVSIHSRLTQILCDEKKERPSFWFPSELSLQTARGVLDCVLNNIEPPAPTSSEGSDVGECRSSTSGCFSSMTESTSPPLTHRHPHQLMPPYRLRLIDDTTSSDFGDDDDDHSDIITNSL